ncbi:MAG TPA: hypothetical protein VE029_08350 [Rhizobacter sp.]|nr:hypothetical protein [Rhizobacter sp.]
MLNFKTSIAAAVVSVGALCAGTAHASNVQWSVGINLPAVTTVVSSDAYYDYAAPAYYAPAPVYLPRPVYQQPAPVVIYRPEPVYVPPQVIRSVWMPPGFGYRHGYRGRDHDHDRWDDRRDWRGDERHDGHRDDHWHR